jgi:hypothetical protein
MAADKFPMFSDMEFIQTDAFPIEDSSARNRLPGSKIVDFVRKIDGELLFVEAKSSFPNPAAAETPERFDEEIVAICDKFAVSLKLFSAIKVGVTEDFLPDAFSSAEKVQVTLALVIRRFENEEWCIPVKKALEQALPSDIFRLWTPNVKVYTPTSAKEFALITDESAEIEAPI